MEKVEIKYEKGGYDKLVDKVKNGATRPATDAAEVVKQLDVKEHDVMLLSKRPDKRKVVEETDEETGKSSKTESIVYVSRLPLSFQKLIVRRAAAFLCGNPIALSASPNGDPESKFLEVVKKVWDDNKLDYKSMELAKMMMAETQCAELWYSVEAEDGYWGETINKGAKTKLRVKILAPSLKDYLYPVFDATGDMIAFGRGYRVKEGDKDVDHFDIYTDTQVIYGKKDGEDWVVDPKPNVFGQIPVIYYTQPFPEWYDVDQLIKRLETVNSNAGDTNDYFASPIVAISGKVEGLSAKEDTGKVVELSDGAKMEYLTWDSAPEATKMEIENLERYIYTLTDTPNISFDEVKGLGTFSGIALKMLFLAAHLKAAEKEGIFGEGIQRRINFIKSALTKVNVKLEKVASMPIKPKFEYYLPQNEQEMIEILTMAAGSGKSIMSQEAAVRQNPLVEDAQAEIDTMKAEGAFGADMETA